MKAASPSNVLGFEQIRRKTRESQLVASNLGSATGGTLLGLLVKGFAAVAALVQRGVARDQIPQSVVGHWYASLPTLRKEGLSSPFPYLIHKFRCTADIRKHNLTER